MQKQISAFVLATRIVQFLYFQSLAIFCAGSALFLSNLFRNHIVGFLMRRDFSQFSFTHLNNKKLQFKCCNFFFFFFFSENKHFSKFLADTLAKDPEERATVLENDEVCILFEP